MWHAKIRIKHDCIFDRRCEKFQVTVSVTSFNPFKKGKYHCTYHLGTVFGSNAEKFLKDIKKDTRVDNIEISGSTFFIIEKRTKKETPGSFYNPELIYVKPVVIDTSGIETWEFAAFRKQTILEFIKKNKTSKLVSIQQTKLQDIYFPRLSPDLSKKQRAALEIAMKEGYYDFPKRVDLEHLAKRSKVTRATFREHLRKAEKKILSNTFI